MDLDNEELDYERLRRNFIKYTKTAAKGKDVPFEIFRSIYDDVCKYMELWNKAETEIETLNKVIDEMANDLTTPINDKKWVINYYKEKIYNKV